MHLVNQGKPWDGRNTIVRSVRRSLLAAPATTVVPGAAAVSIVGKAPATCWDSGNGATVVSAKCSGAKTQQWDFTSAGEIRVTGTSTCVLRSGTNVVLGPCTGASDTKWHLASDGVNFGPIKHQATLDASTVAGDGSISLGSFRNGGGANQLFNGVGKAPDAWTANADNGRTGWYAAENKLTPTSVSATTFGRLANIALDAQMYAHPLVLNAVPVGSSVASSITRNVLLTATMGNTLAAWDADTAAQLWSINLGSPVPAGTFAGYTDIIGPIGIVSTPVIDRTNSVVYCVCTTLEANSTYHHRLHIVDIRTGVKRAGSGVAVAGSVPGTATPQDPNNANHVIFQSYYHAQRPALLLAQGQVWLNFGSYNDRGPYHGWIFSYAQISLSLTSVFCVTPNGNEGAIWGAGVGMSFDGTYIYATTANNDRSGNTSADGADNYAEATLRMSLQGNKLTVLDYFRPADYAYLDTRDADYGTAGTLLIPGTRLGVSNDKNGVIYVLDLDKLGGFQAGSNSQIPQTFNLTNQMFNAPAYAGGYMYVQPKAQPMLAYQFNGTRFATTPIKSAVNNGGAGYGTSGGSVTVTGTGASTVVWGSSLSPSQGPELVAYSQQLDKMLWTSNGTAADAMNVRTKSSPPVVANGKVYLMTDTAALSIYGLK